MHYLSALSLCTEHDLLQFSHLHAHDLDEFPVGLEERELGGLVRLHVLAERDVVVVDGQPQVGLARLAEPRVGAARPLVRKGTVFTWTCTGPSLRFGVVFC